jgi:hypothetical protein
MGSDQEYIYGEHTLLKMIADHDEVRLKLCPERRDDDGWDEVEGAIEISLDREGLNMLIRSTRKLRDRVFGKDE